MLTICVPTTKKHVRTFRSTALLDRVNQILMSLPGGSAGSIFAIDNCFSARTACRRGLVCLRADFNSGRTDRLELFAGDVAGVIVGIPVCSAGELRTLAESKRIGNRF